MNTNQKNLRQKTGFHPQGETWQNSFHSYRNVEGSRIFDMIWQLKFSSSPRPSPPSDGGEGVRLRLCRAGLIGVYSWFLVLSCRI
jgi:hypothetical protein